MKQLIYLLLFLPTFVFAQTTGTIRGFVYDKETGEPVIFTNVVLKGTTLGASTDVNGYYSIIKVPPGDYTISVTYLGYDTLEVPVSVKAGQIVNQKLYIQKSTINLKTVDITAEKIEARTEVKTSVVKITPKEIKQIPTIGGEPDLAQYLQVLPGVIFTGDQGGQLYIRGGSPIQNKVLLDGMIVYNPFHSIGLFSVFDTDIIRNADIYTGGFSAEYGGRISSIMDIKTKDGNKKRLSGKVGASTFGAKLLLEGPLKKQNDDGGGSSSFIFSAKNSYLSQSSKLFYNYIDPNGLPFDFTDLYGKVSLNAANGSKVNFFGFNFNDRVRYKAVSNLNWNCYGGGTNFILVPAGSSLLVEGNFAYSNYLIKLIEASNPPRQSGINGFNMGFNFTSFRADDEIKYGVEILGFQTKFKFYNEFNRIIEQNDNTTEFATYVKVKKVLGKLVLEPSFRAHYYASLSNFSTEPRLGLKYNIAERIRFKASGGFYSQNLIQANSDRDVVNLFYGFLSGPDNLQDKFTKKDGTTKDITHRLQKSNHAIAGFEIDIARNLDFNVEVYNKNFTQLTNLNRNKIFEDNSDNASKPDIEKKDFIIETGQARGIDFTFKYEYKRIYFWAVYSLAKVTRWDGIIEYYPVFDRRHNINLVGSYTFGKDLNWEFDCRWNFGSGFPFTPTQGFYEDIKFTSINTNYVTANGSLGIQYGDLNSKRLPHYHRLDITLKRKFEFRKNITLDAVASITNVYNRENIFYFDRVKYERVNQLPLMPSVGFTLTF